MRHVNPPSAPPLNLVKAGPACPLLYPAALQIDLTPSGRPLGCGGRAWKRAVLRPPRCGGLWAVCGQNCPQTVDLHRRIAPRRIAVTLAATAKPPAAAEQPPPERTACAGDFASNLASSALVMAGKTLPQRLTAEEAREKIKAQGGRILFEKVRVKQHVSGSQIVVWPQVAP